MSINSLLVPNNYQLYLNAKQFNFVVDDNVTAVTGGNQSTSYLLVNPYTIVTSAAAGAGVRLPLGALGHQFTIMNASTKYIQVFPAPGDSVDGYADDTSVIVLATCTAVFTFAANKWNMVANNEVDATKFAGASVDVKINAAFASLPSTGGIVNCEGFGATTQTVSATVNLGISAAITVVKFNPATTYSPQFGNAHMFWLRQNCSCYHLTCDVTNVVFTGKVMKLVDDRYSNQPGVNAQSKGQTMLVNFTVRGGTNLDGIGLYCESLTASQFVQFVNFENIAIVGLGIAINAVVRTDGWFEGNNFYNIMCSNNVCAVKFDTEGTTLENPCPGNQFFGFNYEYDTLLPNAGENIIWLHGPNIVYNSWYGIRLWDIPALGLGHLDLWIDDATSKNNTFMGQVDTTNTIDESGTAIIQDLNGGVYWGNINNTNGVLSYKDIRLTDPTIGYKFNTQKVLWGATDDTIIGPSTPASGSVILRSNNGNNSATFSSAGDFASPHFNVAAATEATAYKIDGHTVLSGNGTDTLITPQTTATGKCILSTNSGATQCTFGSAGVLQCPTVNATTAFQSSGVAGVTAGPFTTISSITVSKGIITAITGS